jgi:integrase
MTDTAAETAGAPDAPARRAAYQCERDSKGRVVALRKQFVDPTTGKRAAVRVAVRGTLAEAEAEMAHRLRSIEHARSAYRFGDAGHAETRRALRTTTAGRVMVSAVWDAYTRTAPPQSRRIRDATWRHRLASTFGELAAADCTELVMREWWARECDRGVSFKTVRNAYDLLSAAFSLAVRSRLVAERPWGAWRPSTPKGARGIEREAARTTAELAALCLAARDHDAEQWRRGQYSALLVTVLVMTLCGLRQGEAAGLAWDCIELEGEAMMRVRFQALDGWRSLPAPEGVTADDHAERPRHPPKNGPRVVRLHEAAVAALRAHRDELRRRGWHRSDGPVFPGKSGRWRTHASVIKPEQLRELVRAAGLPNPERWVTHSLRHTLGTLESVASGDVRHVQARLGHATPAMAMRYMHQAGRGAPASALDAGALAGVVPALPPRPTFTVELDGTPAPLVDLTRASVELATEVEAARAAERRERREAQRRAYRDRGLDFVDLARRELASGIERADHVPAEVRHCAYQNYQRAYHRAIRSGATPAAAQAKGKHSRRATLGAWGAAWRKARTAAPVAAAQ